ncbi:efflux RND transporter permease subunit [Ferrimonas marina]|uniref:Multidrug efflux pump subunit AcrB n=1 Tax=Ferrimonas marina TaxID=299255 RepID=A0A1M5YD26_9GAMM|nr:efflux RND transporter permease subunit [Ferrimonas marina]SHI09927.1 Multidrug efflux pump subunit AcrB [Ferrimonas marina]
MIRYFVRHPTAANLLMGLLLMVGLLSIGSVKRDTFPEFKFNYIGATVVYPGATPFQAEQNLCLRMEDAVDGLSNIREMTCQASEGLASLRLKIDDKADMTRMLVDVQTRIRAIKDFPSEIEPPVVEELEWTEPVIDVAIAADLSMPELKAYAEDLKRRMKLQTGVALINVAGFSNHLLRVELDEVALRRHGLSVNDVATTVRQQNVMMPAGNLELADRNLMLRFDQRQVTPRGLGQLVVAASPDGAQVTLAEIATITDTFELEESKILFDDKLSAALKISKNKSEDAMRVKEKVAAFIEAEQLRAPDGVQLVLSNDLSSLVKDRLNMMVNNGLQGILLVFAVMWLFFSLRYSFWVAAGLPVSFLGAIYMMSVLGISINIMSLVALLMAIGILMDDAIVISESIAAHIEKGLGIDEAVTQGVKKVFPGVLSSYLTTICIFGGMLFLDGQMGAVLGDVPKVLLLVLSISLLEAFLILPAHLAHSMHKQKQREARRAQLIAEGKPVPKQRLVRLQRAKARFGERFEAFRNERLVTAVRWAVQRRYAVFGGVIGLLFASIALLAGGAVKFSAFPELDGDVAEARIILPPGAPLHRTEAVASQISDAAERVAQRYSEQFEGGEPLILHRAEQFNFNVDAGESGPHVATVRLDLRSAEIRQSRIEDFLADWRTEVGELAEPISLVFSQPMHGPGGRAIELRIRGDDLEELKAVSVAVQQYLGQFNGVHNLLDNMRPGKDELLITLRPGAESFGLTGQMVASQLRGAYYGNLADEIQLGPENLRVMVQLDRSQAADLESLARFPVFLADGSQLPLASVADLSWQRGYVRIQRFEGLRTITVFGSVDSRVANASDINRQLMQEALPEIRAQYPNVSFGFEGQAKETQETGDSMKRGFILGLFGIYAILSLQFRSYKEPAVVMIAIPLALIGVLWGHWLTGYDLSMPSIMGFISLSGVVVNDSILLVQYIRHHMERGEQVLDAVVEASRERFRAVFLTSLTTAAGLLPLLMEPSLQAQVVKPMVVSIVFGIFASTLLVLFMIPCAYAIMSDRGWLRREVH